MKIINSKISRCGLYNIYYIYNNYAELRFCNSEDVFIINVESVEKLIDYQWYVKKSDWGYYSTAYINKKIVILSRFLLNAQKGQYVDHINKNTLDNRIENLRFVTNQQNGFNRKIGKNNISGVMGVCWISSRGKWESKIKFNYKSIHLGQYKNINDAIVARLIGEKEYFGEFAPQRHLFDQYGV